VQSSEPKQTTASKRKRTANSAFRINRRLTSQAASKTRNPLSGSEKSLRDSGAKTLTLILLRQLTKRRASDRKSEANRRVKNRATKRPTHRARNRVPNRRHAKNDATIRHRRSVKSRVRNRRSREAIHLKNAKLPRQIEAKTDATEINGGWID
jgi:hypothetical protein